MKHASFGSHALHHKSLAATLLREHDTAEQAYQYAMRKAKFMAATGNGMACDYLGAANQIAATFGIKNG